MKPPGMTANTSSRFLIRSHPGAADKGGSSGLGVLAIGAVGTPPPDHTPTVAVQPLGTSDATPSSAATVADGATAA